LETLIDNKYRLVRRLGVGGMGTVYEAEHAQVGRRVAVKLLNKIAIEGDTRSVSRLQREARLAGSLDSPHITQVLDVGIDPATAAPYLVLEYLEGLDLEQTLRQSGKLSPSLALRVAAQMCLGLRRAHEAGIVHRDVKPANVFLARRESDVVVKLLDFGIAKPTGEELAKLDQSALTTTGALIGSPLYMSPEQARGLKTIDARADVWSTGVVLFTMLAGRTPNHHVTALGELILSICSVVSPSVRDFAPQTPLAVAEIVQRALSIAPDLRFANAAELFDAIAAELDPALKGSARWAIDVAELPAVNDAAEESRRLSPRVATGDPVRGEARRDLTESGNGPVVVSTSSTGGAPVGVGAVGSGRGNTEILPSAALGISSPSPEGDALAKADPPTPTTPQSVVAVRSGGRIPRPLLVGAIASMLVGGAVGAVVVQPAGGAAVGSAQRADSASVGVGASTAEIAPTTLPSATAGASSATPTHSPAAPSSEASSTAAPPSNTIGGPPTTPVPATSAGVAGHRDVPPPSAQRSAAPTASSPPSSSPTATAASTTSFGGRK
jgi:serine/threonine-protein kinase